jgi:23S rRNA (cytosine1962-C5)-methyltransferase
MESASTGDDAEVNSPDPLTDAYALIDVGDERRLERFGDRVLDRPMPAAIWAPRLEPSDWEVATLRFERDEGWSDPEAGPWTLAFDGLVLELRPTDTGQVGFFPEQVGYWPWLRAGLAGREEPSVLHLFAHTGATTLALARSGAQVTHVDGSKPTVGWARRNAELSGLTDAPIRWIVDDALAFTQREARRGRRYDGFVIDPPSFGHGPKGTRWELADALPDLLDACAAVAADDAFVLLTAHTTGLAADDLGDALVDAFDPGPGSDVRTDWIELKATSGATLPLGVSARMSRS